MLLDLSVNKCLGISFRSKTEYEFHFAYKIVLYNYMFLCIILQVTGSSVADVKPMESVDFGLIICLLFWLHVRNT